MSYTISSINNLRVPGYNPIWHNGSNFYCLIYDTTGLISSAQLKIFKASSISGPWAEQDAANRPSSTGEILNTTSFCSTYLASDGNLYFMWGDDGDEFQIDFFDTSTDLYNDNLPRVTFLNQAAGSPTDIWAGQITERGNGDIIVVYTNSPESVKGDDKLRCDYRVSTNNGATWGGSTSIDDGGDIHYGNPVCAPGSQSTDVHFYYQRQTAATPDPPATWNGGLTKTLSTSTLSAAAGNTGADTAGLLRGQTNAVRYNTGTAQRFVLGGASDSRQLERSRADEDGANDLGAPATESSTVTPAIKIEDEAAHACIVGVDPNGDIHWVYSDATDSDIYYATSTDDGDTLVSSTAIELFDGVTANWPSASFIDGYGFLVVWDNGAGSTVYSFNNAFPINAVPSPTSFGTGLAGAGTALTITNVNTTNEWGDGSTNVPATGTGFYTAP